MALAIAPAFPAVLSVAQRAFMTATRMMTTARHRQASRNGIGRGPRCQRRCRRWRSGRTDRYSPAAVHNAGPSGLPAPVSSVSHNVLTVDKTFKGLIGVVTWQLCFPVQ